MSAATAQLPQQFVLVTRSLSPGQASIVLPIPANTNISYVLDEIVFTNVNGSGTAEIMTGSIKDSNGNNYIGGDGIIQIVAGSVARDSSTIDGPIIILPGLGATIAFGAAAPASTAQELTVSGHLL